MENCIRLFGTWAVYTLIWVSKTVQNQGKKNIYKEKFIENHDRKKKKKVFVFSNKSNQKHATTSEEKLN